MVVGKNNNNNNNNQANDPNSLDLAQLDIISFDLKFFPFMLSPDRLENIPVPVNRETQTEEITQALITTITDLYLADFLSITAEKRSSELKRNKEYEIFSSLSFAEQSTQLLNLESSTDDSYVYTIRILTSHLQESIKFLLPKASQYTSMAPSFYPCRMLLEFKFTVSKKDFYTFTRTNLLHIDKNLFKNDFKFELTSLTLLKPKAIELPLTFQNIFHALEKIFDYDSKLALEYLPLIEGTLPDHGDAVLSQAQYQLILKTYWNIIQPGLQAAESAAKIENNELIFSKFLLDLLTSLKSFIKENTPAIEGKDALIETFTCFLAIKALFIFQEKREGGFLKNKINDNDPLSFLYKKLDHLISSQNTIKIANYFPELSIAYIDDQEIDVLLSYMIKEKSKFSKQLNNLISSSHFPVTTLNKFQDYLVINKMTFDTSTFLQNIREPLKILNSNNAKDQSQKKAANDSLDEAINNYMTQIALSSNNIKTELSGVFIKQYPVEENIKNWLISKSNISEKIRYHDTLQEFMEDIALLTKNITLRNTLTNSITTVFNKEKTEPEQLTSLRKMLSNALISNLQPNQPPSENFYYFLQIFLNLTLFKLEPAPTIIIQNEDSHIELLEAIKVPEKELVQPLHVSPNNNKPRPLPTPGTYNSTVATPSLPINNNKPAMPPIPPKKPSHMSAASNVSATDNVSVVPNNNNSNVTPSPQPPAKPGASKFSNNKALFEGLGKSGITLMVKPKPEALKERKEKAIQHQDNDNDNDNDNNPPAPQVKVTTGDLSHFKKDKELPVSNPPNNSSS